MSLSLQMLVIADDLTGANDAGVQFAQAGIRSIVLVNHRVREVPNGYAAVVMNTESRHLPPNVAGERVRHAAELGLKAGVRCLYKKTDSTLRGNIAAELEALRDAAGAAFLPFVPALPDLGRTTRDGIHYVEGVPIGETAFARDPLSPIRASRVSDVLKFPILTLKPSELPPDDYRGVAMLDCASNNDLGTIAQTLAQAGRLRVFSGSVALMRYLLPHLKIESPPPVEAQMLGPILLVNGSVNERSLEQIRHAGPTFSNIKLTPKQLIGGHAALTIPGGGGNLLLYSVAERNEIEAFRNAAAGLSEKELHLRIAERTGQLVHEILASGVYRTLVVFGGDTLAGIARANHWQTFAPLAELEPGVSVSIPEKSDLTLISKAGGFGDLEVISRLVERVT